MKKILQFSGIKVLAVLMIFWAHSSIPSPKVDLGARGCELFFVISGFLYFYNHKNRPIPPTFMASMKYVQKKLVSFLPLHFLTLGIYLILFPYAANTLSEKIVLFIKFIINLFLLQAWSPLSDILYSFNGLVWYVSALLFCCFASPLLARLIKNSSKKYIYFPLIFFIRFALEFIQLNYPNTFFGTIYLHCFPPIRMLEYFMGMMIADFHFDLMEKKLVSNKKFMSLLELLSIILYIFLLIHMQGKWTRAAFVLLACFTIFILSFGTGTISVLLSNKVFQYFSKIQLEFYLFHHIAIRTVSAYGAKIFYSWQEKAIVSFLLSIVLSILYRNILKNKLEKISRKHLEKLSNWLIK